MREHNTMRTTLTPTIRVPGEWTPSLNRAGQNLGRECSRPKGTSSMPPTAQHKRICEQVVNVFETGGFCARLDERIL